MTRNQFMITKFHTKAGDVKVKIHQHPSHRNTVTVSVSMEHMYVKNIRYSGDIKWLVFGIESSFSRLDDPLNIVPLVMRLIRKRATQSPTGLYRLSKSVRRNTQPTPLKQQFTINNRITVTINNATFNDFMEAIRELTTAATRASKL